MKKDKKEILRELSRWIAFIIGCEIGWWLISLIE